MRQPILILREERLRASPITSSAPHRSIQRPAALLLRQSSESPKRGTHSLFGYENFACFPYSWPAASRSGREQSRRLTRLFTLADHSFVRERERLFLEPAKSLFRSASSGNLGVLKKFLSKSISQKKTSLSL